MSAREGPRLAAEVVIPRCEIAIHRGGHLYWGKGRWLVTEAGFLRGHARCGMQILDSASTVS